MREHCCVGERAHSLQITLANGPDIGNGHIDWHAVFSRFSLDATEGDDFLTLGDEFFGDEVNVESCIEAGEKTLEHVLKSLEMAAADGHPFWHVVDDVRRLETAQGLSMARH